MTKKEHIEYWKNTSEKDWEVSEELYRSGKYVYCLFFAHLTIEKLCKANWVKDNPEDHPPRIHHLLKLLSSTTLRISEADQKFLDEFNVFQLEGRYPDYMMKIFSVCTKEYTDIILTKVKTIRTWLLETLQ